jgi:hypothetical protein
MKMFVITLIITISVAEPHHFYAAPGKNFVAAPAALAPTLPDICKFFSTLKGTLSRDFWPLVFFIKQLHLGTWYTGWSLFAYGFVFTEILDYEIDFFGGQQCHWHRWPQKKALTRGQRAQMELFDEKKPEVENLVTGSLLGGGGQKPIELFFWKCNELLRRGL